MDNFLGSGVRANREVHEWETNEKFKFDPIERDLILLLLGKVFSQEDTEHYESAVEKTQTELFSPEEKTFLFEISEKYPQVAQVMFQIFGNFKP